MPWIVAEISTGFLCFLGTELLSSRVVQHLMHFSTFARIAPAAFLALVTVAFVASVRADAPTGNRPFVERVRPDDYYAAERLFDEPYSRTYELVILRTTAAKPVSVLALKPAPSGDGYTIAVNLASSTAPGGWIKVNEELDDALGRQVLRAVELMLHRQVALSTAKRTVSETDTDLWLYQRLGDGTIAAARIPMEATLDNPRASTFIDEFLGALEQLIGKEGDARAAHLKKIDRIATEIILSESP